MENIEKFSKIRFNDFADYNSDKCRNGGCYGFWTEYTRSESGEYYEVSYGTTSDLEFCPVCGNFNDHYDIDSPHDSGYSCGEYEIVTKEEVIELINSFKETEDEYITYEN